MAGGPGAVLGRTPGCVASGARIRQHVVNFLSTQGITKLSSKNYISNRETLARFYAQCPYPAPETDLDKFERGDATLDGSPSHFMPLYWPNRKGLAGLDILVAGCGTSQALKYALLCREAHVLGTDITEVSLDHARRLKDKYELENLELRYSPVEESSQLENQFESRAIE